MLFIKHIWKDAFWDSSCLYLQKWTPWPNREEYHKYKNTKVVSLDEKFPMVWRAPQSNFRTKIYRNNTIIFSFFSLIFASLSLHFSYLWYILGLVIPYGYHFWGEGQFFFPTNHWFVGEVGIVFTRLLVFHYCFGVSHMYGMILKSDEVMCEDFLAC